MTQHSRIDALFGPYRNPALPHRARHCSTRAASCGKFRRERGTLDEKKHLCWQLRGASSSVKVGCHDEISREKQLTQITRFVFLRAAHPKADMNAASMTFDWSSGFPAEEEHFFVWVTLGNASTQLRSDLEPEPSECLVPTQRVSNPLRHL